MHIARPKLDNLVALLEALVYISQANHYEMGKRDSTASAAGEEGVTEFMSAKGMS